MLWNLIRSLILTLWSIAWQYRHNLEACSYMNFGGPNPILLSKNQHFKEIARSVTCVLKFEKQNSGFCPFLQPCSVFMQREWAQDDYWLHSPGPTCEWKEFTSSQLWRACKGDNKRPENLNTHRNGSGKVLGTWGFWLGVVTWPWAFKTDDKARKKWIQQQWRPKDCEDSWWKRGFSCSTLTKSLFMLYSSRGKLKKEGGMDVPGRKREERSLHWPS